MRKYPELNALVYYHLSNKVVTKRASHEYLFDTATNTIKVRRDSPDIDTVLESKLYQAHFISR